MSYVLKCASCGKKLLEYDTPVRKYGSPLKECKKCGARYIDPRYHELAAEGIPEEDFKIPPYIFLIVIGVLIAWRGIYLFSRHMLGTPEEVRWLLPTVFLVFGIVFVIGGILEILSVKSGRKMNKFNRLYEESCKRLENPSYALTLHSMGYKVPEQYLGGIYNEGNRE